VGEKLREAKPVEDKSGEDKSKEEPKRIAHV
jgi:hypothetical protein